MRVVAFVPSIHNTSPGQRFRIEQWAPGLRQYGLDIHYEPFESPRLNAILYSRGKTASKALLIADACLRRVSAIRTLKDFDAAYIYREAAILGPAVFERCVHVARLPIVYDFDDAVFLRQRSPFNGWFSLLKCPGKTGSVCRLASHVIVGNSYLAEYARKFNKNVTLVPTTVDTDRYAVRPEGCDPERLLTIGWTGSHSTIPHLDTVREALSILATRVHFRVRVIGTPSYQIPGIDVESLAWRADREIEDLAAIDIGIMPLPDDEWCKGKCGFKAIQYMALGIPTVCSPVGVNSSIIRDGENGFLAQNVHEWVAKLTALLNCRDLRLRLGAAGRASIESFYSTRAQIPRLYHIFESVVKNA
jgi:glycosyltransferase involved in cell wall biosynthesis